MNITLTSIVTLVIALLIIRFATRVLFKVIGWLLLVVLVVYGLYYWGLPPFENNPYSIRTWEAKYCGDPDADVRCSCIVQPIKNDIESRFTKSELEALEDDRLDMLYTLWRSYEGLEDQIKRCLAEDQAEDQLDVFIKDMIPINNEILDELSNLSGFIEDEADAQVNKLEERKRKIDERFD